MKHRNQFSPNTITITGIIIPIEWDENGNPTDIAVSTYDEQEYWIDDKTPRGRDLRKLIRKKISVTGSLQETIKKRKKLIVEGYLCL